MSTRARSRHRASVRPNTPLSSLSTAVTGQMNALGRGGVVIAMSSGLVATMGLPAQAASNNATSPDAAAAPAAAPASAAPAGAAFTSASLTAAPALQAAAPLTAPANATVDFEDGSFTAIPKPKVQQPSRSADSGSGTSSKSYESAGFSSAKGSSVLSVAARYIGVAYRYGGTTPGGGFDCSGAVKYIFNQVGVSLPRTANQQMLATTRVSRSNAKKGDLVFFLEGGRAYHVGIYAGGNMMFDAGRSGSSFSKRQIWSNDVVFGSV